MHVVVKWKANSSVTVRAYESEQRDWRRLARRGLQYGCCNLGWKEFCQTYVIPANCNKIRSRRADSNR